MDVKKVIGINALTYPEIRNFAGHDFENYRFKKVIDFYKLPSFILFRLFNKINRKWQNTFLDFGLNKVHFFHFFNTINAGKRPFITTYETTLPRWNDTSEDFRKGLELLAGKNCIKIIALSECSAAKQRMVIQEHRPDLLDIIMNKNVLLLPPQSPLLNNIHAKRVIKDRIVFTIVGADFFRKGGIPILNVFEKLCSENRPVVLNIVSTMNYGDYASKTSKEDFQNALALFERFKEKIFWHRQLDNEKVKTLLLDSDVALLPSIAETFGYFILEAQAAGCPVITTDIRAMPEINNEEKGWLIDIKSDAYDADLTKLDEIYSIIESGLTIIIHEILENPSIIRKKGEAALNDILVKHSPLKHMETLRLIYNKI